MAKTVYNITARAPRPTFMALWIVVRLVGLPLIGGLVLFDVAVWWIVEATLGVCFGIWCWI